MLPGIDETMIFNYSDVFFAHYFNNDVKCHKMIEYHALMYLYSGELIVDENNNQTRITSGQCVFIRKDNRITLTKNPVETGNFRQLLWS